MSQLAAKVGISKTAIYRHFKNKDAVVENMKEQFFDIFYALVGEGVYPLKVFAEHILHPSLTVRW